MRSDDRGRRFEERVARLRNGALVSSAVARAAVSVPAGVPTMPATTPTNEGVPTVLVTKEVKGTVAVSVTIRESAATALTN